MATFVIQIAYLKGNFDIVSLDELVENYKHNYRLGKDTVTITFDDGFRDNYTNAYSLLKNTTYQLLYFVTGFVGKNLEILNINDIKIMQKGNIVFGAHTITHKILSEVDRETALSEISGSKSALEEIRREKVKYFAYPKGKRRDFTEATMEMVNEADYVAAFSTKNGRISHNSNVFALNRIGMRDYPLFVFKVRVSGIFENRCLHMLRRFIGLI